MKRSRNAWIAASALTLTLPALAQKNEKDAVKAKAPSPAPAKSQSAASASPKPAPGKKAASPAPSPAASPSPAPSPATSPAPVTVIVQNAPPTEPKSDLVSGWIGLAILGAGGFFGWRYLKSRGTTVTGAFRQMGVDLPKDAPGGTYAPPRPQVPQLPPLPSLADLPTAGAAPPLAPAPIPSGGPRLVGGDGQNIGLAGMLTIGRDPENGLTVADNAVSRRHARIEPQGGGWTIEDLGSSNGTKLNGQRISGAQPLRPGDEIQVGDARFRFEA